MRFEGKIHTILERWGSGRRMNDASHIDYPHETPFNRIRRSPGRAMLSAEGLSDEDFCAVDRAVSETSEIRRRVLVMYYINRKPDGKIAKALKDTRQAITALRQGAERDVEVRLYGESEN